MRPPGLARLAAWVAARLCHRRRHAPPDVPLDHAERQEDEAVRHKMAQSGVAEGRCEQRPPGRSGPHRQVPATTEQQLINQFLQPGQAQQNQW